MTTFRQGDVLVIYRDRAASGGTPVPREGGRVVLAHGEATGHVHALVDDDVELFETAPTPSRSGRHLRLVKRSALLHEEHAPVTLPKGQPEVRRQREYQPGSIRNIAD